MSTSVFPGLLASRCRQSACRRLLPRQLRISAIVDRATRAFLVCASIGFGESGLQASAAGSKLVKLCPHAGPLRLQLATTLLAQLFRMRAADTCQAMLDAALSHQPGIR